MSDMETYMREKLGEQFFRCPRPSTEKREMLNSTRARRDELAAYAKQRIIEAELLDAKRKAHEREQAKAAREKAELEKAARFKDASTRYHYKRVLSIISIIHDVPLKSLLSASRIEAVKLARFHAVWWLREKSGLSFPQIGYRLGRDHSTCMHAYGYVKKNMEVFEPFIRKAASYLDQPVEQA